MLDQEDASGPAPHGMLDSLRRVLSTVIELLYTRAELFTTEVEEEFHRAAGLLLWALVAIIAGGFTILLLSLTVVIAFWDDHRLLAALFVTLLFAIVFGVALFTLRTRIRSRPPLLAETLAELRRDRDALGGKDRG
ncbi:MAG: hypothetical protein RLZZ200_1175 [Pseudomonadota bacterium]|jgi:uncharacterized membrane protein YqjE